MKEPAHPVTHASAHGPIAEQGSTLIETELGGISHPNQYFEHSSKFYAEKELKEQEKLTASKAPAAPPAADAVMAQ